MSGRWTSDIGGGESSQDFTQATQEECALGEAQFLYAVSCSRLVEALFMLFQEKHLHHVARAFAETA